MTFTSLSEIPSREIVPGFRGKLIHTDNVTFAHWDIEAGSVLPEHAHIHEQITMLLEGQFELAVAGETRQLQPGAIAVIPGNVSHAGWAITACRIVDVFHPTRDDYR